MARYHDAEDGEWIEPPADGHNYACCDCGLTHRMNFRVVRGRVQFQAFRNARSTALLRRQNRYTFRKRA